MQRVPLGNSPFEVSRLGFGAMGMSDFYGGERDETASIKVLHAAVDRGINFIDTADVYGSGHNEELLARAFAGRWDDVVLATKFSAVRTPEGKPTICAEPAYVKEACERSLRRLGRETIDLYYQHRPDPNVPIEDSIGAMKDLVEAGKVRAIGISEFSPDQIRRAHATHPVSALQTEYSLWSREPEGEILDTCRERGITFVAYSPLGRGFLTGAIPNKDVLDAHDWRRKNPRFTDEAVDRNRVFVDLVKEIAEGKGATPAQVALAWVLAQGDDIVPIPGTRRIERLDDNIGALSVKFSEAELAEIRAKLPAETAGARY